LRRNTDGGWYVVAEHEVTTTDDVLRVMRGEP